MDKNCTDCDGACCKYVSVEIDCPEELEDFENVKWYINHQKVSVYVDEDYSWYLQFSTPCKHLGEGNTCMVYEKRPAICRGYSHDECTFHNDDYKELFTFNTMEEVENYVRDVFEKGEHVIPDLDSEEEEEDEI